MSETTISLIIAAAGFILSLTVVFLGRQNASNTTGREWGEMQTNLKHIMADVKEIKEDIRANSQASVDMLNKEEEARKAEDRRLHDKFEEHIQKYHST